jgi:UDP-N-acetylmuramoylalanine--D-glutamate ligase
VNGNMVTIDGAEICTTDELKLLGAHNWQNVCAAVTAYWQVDQNIDAARLVLTSFTGLEHRLEFVRELAGVAYYDDSFGTTPETAIVAMQAFAEPKVVILGGSDKGARYDALAKAVTENNVRAVLLIGSEAVKIGAALTEAGFNDAMPGGNNMAEIVANARNAALDGDVVLLSTGCASFGMFQDYKDRGNQFKQQVEILS